MDGRDLTAKWWTANPDDTHAWNVSQFAALDPASGTRLLGLLQPGHMQYEADRKADPLASLRWQG